MSNDSTLHHNPLIQATTTDTLSQCSFCLSYISQSVHGLINADYPAPAHEGIASLLNCIATALDYEQTRLANKHLLVVDE